MRRTATASRTVEIRTRTVALCETEEYSLVYRSKTTAGLNMCKMSTEYRSERVLGRSVCAWMVSANASVQGNLRAVATSTSASDDDQEDKRRLGDGRKR